jgi:hypothetical protein
MKQRHFKSMVFEASGSEPTLEIKSPFRWRGGGRGQRLRWRGHRALARDRLSLIQESPWLARRGGSRNHFAANHADFVSVSRSPESFAASRSAFYGSMLHKAETCHVLHKRRRDY